MEKTNRITTIGKRGITTSRLLSTATVFCLILSATNALAQTEFNGSLKNVSITDAAGTNSPPMANFTYSQEGDIITFDAGSSSDSDGSITEYKWDFDDGTKSSGVTASHQDVQTTGFIATLTVVDNQGGVSILQQAIKTASALNFYWNMDSLPAPTMISDEGDVTITLYKNAATSILGVHGNAMHQTGLWNTYAIPMSTIPSTKGVIEFYAKHDNPPNTSDSTSRFFFKSTNESQANSIYAYTYKNTTFFYLIDSTGVSHRTYKVADTWQIGSWYKYEFVWDSANGYLGITRDGTVVTESTTTPWSTPNWGTQDMYIGHLYPIGSFDEFKIY